jgi:hypothetical protein
MQKLKEQLLDYYKARDLGPVGFYLGRRVLRDSVSHLSNAPPQHVSQSPLG